jgi:cold shock CspA family protein
MGMRGTIKRVIANKGFGFTATDNAGTKGTAR